MGLLLTKEQENEILQIDRRLTKQELDEYFNITPSDLKNISSNRGAQNRLGYAVQLYWLRYTGTTFSDTREIPPHIVKHVAKQLDINPVSFQEYGQRRQTRSLHIRKLCDEYSFKTFDQAKDEIIGLINEELRGGKNSQTLIVNVVNYAKLKKIILPTIGALEELVRDSRIELENIIFEKILAQLSETQIAQLDKVIESEPKGVGGNSMLARIKNLPLKNNTKAICDICGKIKQIREFNINLDLSGLHQNMVSKYATSCRNFNIYQMRRFPEKKRYSLLAILFHHQERVLTDAAINICNRVVYGILKDGRNKLKKKNEEFGSSMRNSILYYFKSINKVRMLVYDKNVKESELRNNVKQILEDPILCDYHKAVETIKELPSDTIALIEKRNRVIRQFAYQYLNTINFKSDTSGCKSLLDAMEKSVPYFESKKKLSNDMPTDFLSAQWIPYVVNNDGTINSSYYEIAMFESLRTEVLSSNVYVDKSNSYRNLDQYLISKEEFKAILPDIDKFLCTFPSYEQYIESVKSEISEGYKHMASYLSTGDDLFIKDHSFHVSKLTAASPKEADGLRDELYSLIPNVKLPDLLFEVAKWTDFCKCITEGTSIKARDISVIMAALLSLGTNMGAERMALSSNGISATQIATAIATYLTEDDLKKIQSNLVNYQKTRGMAQYWGNGKTSSSDGMRVEYGGNSRLAVYNPHFGNRKGVTYYRHTSDQYSSFSVYVICTNDREAKYMMDGLLEHNTDLEIEEHYTDTAGYTDQGFGLSRLFGFSLSPRIRDVSNSVIYKFSDTIIPDELKDVHIEKIDENTIKENYNEILRIAYSIKNGYVPCSLMLSKLSRKTRHNVIAKALNEFGRIEKTRYLQCYFTDESLRRRVQVGLNKGEHMNGIARVLFFGQDQKLRKKGQTGQRQAALALNILINAICIWNTVYLERAYDELKKFKTIDESSLSHISPLKWKHIAFHGEFKFDPTTALGANEYRDLIGFSK